MDDNEKEDKGDHEDDSTRSSALFSKKFQDYLSGKKGPNIDFNSNLSRPVAPRTMTNPYDQSPSPSSDESESSETYRRTKKVRKRLKDRPTHKAPEYVHMFRDKLTQCSMKKESNEIAPPNELRPLLANMSLLLQELKQAPPNSSESDSLYSLMSRVTILLTEFSKRAIKKMQMDKKGEHSKNFDKTNEAIMDLLNDYKQRAGMECDNGVREYKRMERELTNKNQKISEVKRKLSRDNIVDSKSSDINLRVRRSIINNDRLKADIKSNQDWIKKYRKILMDKEWTKHKMDTEVFELKEKISNLDISDSDDNDKVTASSEAVDAEMPKNLKNRSPPLRRPKPKRREFTRRK